VDIKQIVLSEAVEISNEAADKEIARSTILTETENDRLEIVVVEAFKNEAEVSTIEVEQIARSMILTEIETDRLEITVAVKVFSRNSRILASETATHPKAFPTILKSASSIATVMKVKYNLRLKYSMIRRDCREAKEHFEDPEFEYFKAGQKEGQIEL
jgi:hypothetical protein